MLVRQLARDIYSWKRRLELFYFSLLFVELAYTSLCQFVGRGKLDPEGCYIIEREIHPKQKSHEISIILNIYCIWPVVVNFAESMAASPPCSLQNFKTIGQLRNE